MVTKIPFSNESGELCDFGLTNDEIKILGIKSRGKKYKEIIKKNNLNKEDIKLIKKFYLG